MTGDNTGETAGTPPRAIVLVERHWIGHHGPWFKRIARGFLAEGAHVIALCPEPDELRAWLGTQDLPGDAFDRLRTGRLPAPPRVPPWFRPFRVRRAADGLLAWRQEASLVRKLADRGSRWAPGLMFYTSFEQWRFQASPPALVKLAMPWPICVLFITMSRELLENLAGAGKAAPRGGVLPGTLKGMYLLDERLCPVVTELLGIPCEPFPEFTNHSPPELKSGPARALLDFAAGRQIIGLYGLVTERKGLYTFLDAAEVAHREGLPWVFAVVGQRHFPPGHPEHARLDERLKSVPPGNCFLHLECVSESAFSGLIAASHVLAGVYIGHPYSSNLQSWAAAQQLPIIVGEGGLMAYRNERYGLGPVIPISDVEALLAALHTCLDAGSAAPACDPAGAREFAAAHDERRLREVVRNCLEIAKAPLD